MANPQDDLAQDETFRDLLQEKARESKGGKRSTDMLLTLNLNEYFPHMSTEQKQKFRDFGVSLFDDRKILEYFEDKESPDNPLANVEAIDIKWKPELGLTQRLHLHALVSLEHHGFMGFKANQLRDDARALFGHSIYLNCPLSSNGKILWENYLNKGFPR